MTFKSGCKPVIGELGFTFYFEFVGITGKKLLVQGSIDGAKKESVFSPEWVK